MFQIFAARLLDEDIAEYGCDDVAIIYGLANEKQKEDSQCASMLKARLRARIRAGKTSGT
jgi:hypothetical protein